ncbi:hypothetical protein SBOR_5142 [Sclerotinia borealis F-4128]|uniref:Uncharacterized protein n=1 Tax=Sclerotinia borealis (strain F-4128) TaxID=1432307 RepID=W9CIH9_SCLBF|nr:hypothetical protein SBOR_5142 [Sclerotinia borealis F-4128]
MYQAQGYTTGTEGFAADFNDSDNITDTRSAPSGGGYYKYQCKYWMTFNCPQWVNNAPCAHCLAEGRDDEHPIASVSLLKSDMNISLVTGFELLAMLWLWSCSS